MGLNEDEYFASGHRACAGCAEALAIRHILKAAGKNTIVAHATGCMEVVSTPYPETAWKLPWVHAAFQNVSAVASGVREALNAKGQMDTNVIAFGGDGASFDIGFASLSGALERGHKFLYVATDNEAYMNTGIQRSGATFPYANTTTSPAGKVIHGKENPKKPLPFIVAAHGIEYVASTSVTNLFDLKTKVEKALKVNGPSFIHVMVSCVPGWKIEPSQSIEILRKSIECGIFVPYEIEKGILKLNQPLKERKPVDDYLKSQGRFKHVTPQDIQKIQAYVDERYNFLIENNGKKLFDNLYR
ncbi:MAG: thiamine pyrophosphate-dependent enzyme [Candidatus ainarchaeum sp.]|nr:thiamine pyrophosphate-dependent enzyme [Candidatus ainarchaeum sp.]